MSFLCPQPPRTFQDGTTDLMVSKFLRGTLCSGGFQLFQANLSASSPHLHELATRLGDFQGQVPEGLEGEGAGSTLPDRAGKRKNVGGFSGSHDRSPTNYEPAPTTAFPMSKIPLALCYKQGLGGGVGRKRMHSIVQLSRPLFERKFRSE